MGAEPAFTLGIEEEYLLVDVNTLELANDPPASLLDDCQKLSGKQIAPEFLRSQVEVGTKVCTNISEAREDLTHLRRIIVDVAATHGLAPIAASTHPSAIWSEQKHTDRQRYANFEMEMQAAVRRLLICGMHVHVGIEDDELRIDLMNQMRYFLPHLLMLSSSSPFWEGQDTGLRSYRLTVFDALPRTGVTPVFESYAEYQRHLEVLTKAGVIEDGTMVWWDIRPSARYQTLETRVLDVCTNIEDALCIAALTSCLFRMLYRLRLGNQRWRIYNPMLLDENRWRAMRYGFDDGLLDLAKGKVVPFPELLDEILELITEDAEALGCTAEVEHARIIIKRGSSSDRQRVVYLDAIDSGADSTEALREVVRFLAAETAQGL
ncbi:MAG: carboxylate-amine ligase [Gammaproteobacteria bacterium]|nr:carboxylate-amine ligase [Gammaproteobacteria bacterium]